MKAAQWKKVKTLYQRAIETAPEKRPVLLDESCGEDADLRREIEEMLRFHDTDSSAFEEPVFEVATKLIAERETLPIGVKLDNYRIVREIGRGGMGVVYEAERTDGLFEQRAAVKIIKRGMDTDAILNRFTLERQILASLEHPNIARLLDGGTTDDGLPYFVMEYVEGLPIDKFCAEKSLTETLKLFRKVCSAVQFAHQNLVIHRDLKPSNIIISKDGEPKLLDFGIAKLFHAEPNNETELTETANRLLTPEYASPEQTKGEKITTQSDVYSLGILLSKLIQKPKTKDQKPNQDLEAILQTALRDEMALRYSSVEAFSEDIRRFLEGLPILARKDSFFYRAAKFVKRNSAAVLFSALTIFALVFAGVFSAWQARRANLAQIKSEQRFNEVRRLSGAMLFEYHDRVANLQGSTELRQKMLTDSLQYLDNLAQDSETDATLLRELGTAYRKIGDAQGKPFAANTGDTRGALESYRKSERIFLQLLETAPDNRDFQTEIAQTYERIGSVLYRQFEVEPAIETHQKSLVILEKLSAENPSDDNLKMLLAKTLVALGDSLAGKSGLHYGSLPLEKRIGAEGAESEKPLAESLEHFRRALKLNRETTEKNLTAENLFEVYVAIQRIAFRLDNFGFHREEAGKKDEALRLYRESLENHREAQKALLKASEIEPENAQIPRNSANCKMLIAEMQTKLGDFKTALQNYSEAKNVFEELAAKDTRNKEAKRDLVTVIERLGRFYVATKNGDEAVRHYQKAVEIMSEIVRTDSTKSDEENLKSLKWWAENAKKQILKSNI